MKTAVVNYNEKSFQFVIEDENEYIQKTLLTNGKFYETDLLDSLTKLIKVGDGVVLDIGANLGNHSIFFAGVLGLEVHAFEPLVQTYDLLQQNIKINEFENKIFANNSAVGSESGWCEINNVDPSNLGSTTVSQSETGKIPLITIDSYLEMAKLSARIKLIKIDVEGFEIAVLTGAMKTIKQFRPLLIIECQNVNRLYETLTTLENDYFVYDVNCVTPTFTLIHKSYAHDKLINENKKVDIPFYINKLLHYSSIQNGLNLKYREINSKYKKLQAQYNIDKEELDNVRLKYREISERVSLYKDNLNEASLKYRKSTEQLSQLNTQLVESRKLLTTLEEKERNVQIALNEARIKYKESTEREKDLKIRVDESHSNLKVFLEDFKALTIEKTKIQEDLILSQSKCYELELSKQTQQNEIANLTNRLNEKTQKNTELVEQLNDANMKYRRVTEDNRAIKLESNSEVKYQIAKVKYQIEEKDNTIFQLKERLSSANIKYRNVTEQIHYYKNLVSDLTAERDLLKRSFFYRLGRIILFKKA